MNPGAIEAIVGGYHGDPFAVLGPHTTGEDGGGWVVRCLQPGAESVEVLVSSGAIAAEKVHPAGFFEATLSSDPGRYRLRLHRKDGKAEEVEDTYRSFTVNSKLARSDAQARAYAINSVPMVIVDGKYMTQSSMSGGHAGLPGVLDQLIAKARTERKS